MATLANTVGCQLAAAFVSCFTCGALLVYVYDYHQRFPNDRIFYRVIVYLMTTMSFLDTVFNCTSVWNTLIVHFGSTTYFLRVHWQLCTLIPWIGTTDFLLQIFLTWRIYAVSGKKWRVFPAVAMLFSIAGTVLPYYVAIWLRGQALVTALNEMKPLIWAWWALHAWCDVMTTSALMWFIVYVPWRNGTGSSTTSLTLRHIVVRAVESNALSLVWQTAIIVPLALSDKAGFAYLIPAQSITKTYTFSLIVALNTRTSTASKLDHAKDSSGRYPTGRDAGVVTIGGGTAKHHGTGMGMGGRNRYGDVEVTVQHETRVDEDEDLEKAAESYRMDVLDEHVERQVTFRGLDAPAPWEKQGRVADDRPGRGY